MLFEDYCRLYDIEDGYKEQLKLYYYRMLLEEYLEDYGNLDNFSEMSLN